MDTLERARLARMTPLERAYDLLARGVMPEQWPDAELDAYTDRHCRHLECLSDDQLIELYNCANSDVAATLYYGWTGRTLPEDETIDPMHYWIKRTL